MRKHNKELRTLKSRIIEGITQPWKVVVARDLDNGRKAIIIDQGPSRGAYGTPYNQKSKKIFTNGLTFNLRYCDECIGCEDIGKDGRGRQYCKANSRIYISGTDIELNDLKWKELEKASEKARRVLEHLENLFAMTRIQPNEGTPDTAEQPVETPTETAPDTQEGVKNVQPE